LPNTTEYNIELPKTVYKTPNADNTTFYNNGTAESFNYLIKAIHDFGTLSGLHLNSNKTIVLRIGSLRNTNLYLQTTRNFSGLLNL